MNGTIFLFQKWAYRVKEGWYGFDLDGVPIDIIHRIDALLLNVKDKSPNFKILQIKVKYNNLRIYLDDYDNELFENEISELESIKI